MSNPLVAAAHARLMKTGKAVDAAAWRAAVDVDRASRGWRPLVWDTPPKDVSPRKPTVCDCGVCARARSVS